MATHSLSYKIAEEERIQFGEAGLVLPPEVISALEVLETEIQENNRYNSNQHRLMIRNLVQGKQNKIPMVPIQSRLDTKEPEKSKIPALVVGASGVVLFALAAEAAYRYAKLWLE